MKQMTPRTDAARTECYCGFDQGGTCDAASRKDEWGEWVPYELSEQLETELNTLKQWKDEQLAVEATWDAQAVGNELDLLLGSPTRPQILPAIKMLKAALEREQQDFAALRQMVSELRDALEQTSSCLNIWHNAAGFNCQTSDADALASAEIALAKANQLLP